MKPNPPNVPSRRHRHLAIYVVAVCAVLAALFYAVLSRRGGTDYKGDLPALLPPDTSVFLSLDGLNSMWDRFEKLKVFDALRDDIDLSALFLDEETWSEFQEKRESVEFQAQAGLLRRFVRRWFGSHVAAAGFPVEGQNEPALVLLAETEAGFEENLAELIAKWLPDFGLEEEVYRDTALTRYRGDSPSKNFAYCRFGRTVAISFRSSSFTALRALVDRRLDAHEESQQTLSTNPRFSARFGMRDSGAGLFLYADASPMFATLEKAMSEKLEQSENTRGNFIFLRDFFESRGEIVSQASLEDYPPGLRAKFSAGSAEDSPGAVGEISTGPSRILSALPRDTLLCIAGKSERSGALLREWTFGFPEDAEVREETEEFAEFLIEMTGLSLERDLLAELQGEVAAACTKLSPGLALPSLEGFWIAQVKDSGKMHARLEQAFAHFQAKGAGVQLLGVMAAQRFENGPGGLPYYAVPMLFPGIVEIGMVGDFLVIATTSGALLRLEQWLEESEANLDRSPEFQLAGLSTDGAHAFLAYANFRAAKQALDDLSQRSLLWGGKIRSYVRDSQDIVDLLDLLRCVRVSSIPRGGAAPIEIFIPLE